VVRWRLENQGDPVLLFNHISQYQQAFKSLEWIKQTADPIDAISKLSVEHLKQYLRGANIPFPEKPSLSMI
jgi:hypothetical protein